MEFLYKILLGDYFKKYNDVRCYHAPRSPLNVNHGFPVSMMRFHGPGDAKEAGQGAQGLAPGA